MIREGLVMDKMLVEIKARVPSIDDIRKLIVGKYRFVGVFHQIDTYYDVPRGRLKIREIEGREGAQLVYYLRENIEGPKKSLVKLANIHDVDSLKSIFDELFGVKVIVDKIREIYLYQGVQVHLDKVEGLGEFIEFELEVDENKFMNGRKKLQEMMNVLGIKEKWLIKGSYSDLLLEKANR